MLEAIGGSGFYRSVVGWHVELECNSSNAKYIRVSRIV
jgi:hypothetical protein